MMDHFGFEQAADRFDQGVIAGLTSSHNRGMGQPGTAQYLYIDAIGRQLWVDSACRD
tara:strand:- start:2934 stop:3104 length:171 start_codon:yes stop_codon:yes gene_type:complete